MEDIAIMQDDNALFLLVQERNDVEAFKVLYRRYHKRIFAYCLQFVKDEEGARDAFQNTFAAVYEQRSQFVPGEFSKWLFTIAKRQSMKLYTQMKADRLPEDHDDASLERIIDEDDRTDADTALTQMLNTAIRTLSPEFQDVLRLRYYEDLAYEDIAVRLGISLSLAKVRVNRAKAQLQQALHLHPDDLS
jgi:RNA polymerase sigma-70 factor (ECF subfamily)